MNSLQNENFRKGKSRLKAVSNFVALDVETTGLSPYTDKIIEIGLVRVRGGIEQECFSSLIQPGRRVSSRITELTGITNEMLSGAPAMCVILPMVMEFIGDDIIVGHNVNFDIGFMQAACFEILKSGFTNDYVDTMQFSRKHFKELPNHRLSTLVCSFGITIENAHRALVDARATTGCYLYMCRQVALQKKNAAPRAAITALHDEDDFYAGI